MFISICSVNNAEKIRSIYKMIQKMHYESKNVILILKHTEIKIRSNNTYLCYFIFCCIFSIPYYIKYECPIKYLVIIRLNVINMTSYLQSL